MPGKILLPSCWDATGNSAATLAKHDHSQNSLRREILIDENSHKCARYYLPANLERTASGLLIRCIFFTPSSASDPRDPLLQDMYRVWIYSSPICLSVFLCSPTREGKFADSFPQKIGLGSHICFCKPQKNVDIRQGAPNQSESRLRLHYFPPNRN